MDSNQAGAVILLSIAALACGADSSTDGGRRFPTSEFVYRDATLGGSCAESAAFEGVGATDQGEAVEDGERTLAFAEGESRFTLLRCQDGELCSYSLTEFFPEPEPAEARCQALRQKFLVEIGDPSLDLLRPGFLPPNGLAEEDAAFMRGVVWRLSHSQLKLFCPLQAGHRDQWAVSIYHTADPQLLISRTDGSRAIKPARSCLVSQ